jgi:hypothetical protein
MRAPTKINAVTRPRARHTQIEWDALRVLSLADLQQRGRTTEDILAELHRMDFDTLAGLDSKAEGSVQQWKPVVEKNPAGLAFVVDSQDRIVAYWHFVALHEEMFARAVRGELEDGEITADEICSSDTPGVYNIYLVIIAALRQYRGLRMIWMLMDVFFQRLEELAENGFYVRHMCANAFTAEGTAICRLGEMQHIGPHQRCGDIYLLDLPETDWLLARYSGLREKYAVRFGC